MYLYIKLLVIEGPVPSMCVLCGGAGGATPAWCLFVLHTEGYLQLSKRDAAIVFHDPNFQCDTLAGSPSHHRFLLSALDSSVTAAG